MLKLLILSAILSLAANLFIERKNMGSAWVEGFAILLAVALVSLVRAVSDWRREQQFQKLNEFHESKKTLSVMREGVLKIIHQGELLVGDVVKLESGMKIPVDGVIIQSSGVLIDESSMTGQSKLIKKADLAKCEEIIERENLLRLSPHSMSPFDYPSPVLLSGTTVNQGEGYFVVLVVGPNTVAGRLQANVYTEYEPTPLQQKLEVLATQVGKIGLVVGFLIFLILVTRYFIEEINEPDGLTWKVQHLTYCLRCLTVGITVIVVAIPEGLPMAVTISLGFSVSKMIADRNFVKKLQSCELMGSVTVICSDKTGTLTRNEMNVTNLWMGKEIEVPLYERIDQRAWNNSEFRELLYEGIVCNSSSSATQQALFRFVEKEGVDIERLKGESEKGSQYLFTSRRKRMSVILNSPRQGFGRRIHMKGAAQVILNRCNWYIDEEGVRRPLSSELLDTQFADILNSMAVRAMRILCLAFKELDPEEGHEDDHQSDPIVEEGGFTCLALVGLKDVIRDNVPASLEECKDSGIRVIMVTGDNGVTSLQIGKECGLVRSQDEGKKIQMNGAEFNEAVRDLLQEFNTGSVDQLESARHHNIEEFARITKDLKVLSRASPQDKYLLVSGLKLMHEIVAVTGDGTNDAPALVKAHVGLAMGIRGTSVAKEAADMIILDDNFLSVVNAVAWGRNFYDNIKRFLQFQLTANVVTLIVTFVDSCIIQDSVLTPMQLLWVNLMMDSLASIALTTDRPTRHTLNSRPVHPAQSIVTSSMKVNILIQAIYQCMVIFVLVFLGDYFIPQDCSTLPHNPHNCALVHGAWTGDQGLEMKAIYGASRHFTVVFNTMVWMSLFNEINSRKMNNELNVFRGLSQNKLFILVWVTTALTQIVLIELSGDLFGVSRIGLNLKQWLICLGFGIGTLFLRFIWLSFRRLCGIEKQKSASSLNISIN